MGMEAGSDGDRLGKEKGMGNTAMAIVWGMEAGSDGDRWGKEKGMGKAVMVIAWCGLSQF